MKPRLNICHIYLFVILLCALNGTLYTGGGPIAQGLQYVLILMSLYYALYANLKYKIPVFFKALNVLLIMFTIYGVIYLFFGEKVLKEVTVTYISKTDYLKGIYKSLLPIYAFYVFSKKGLLTEKTIKTWFVIFLILAVRSFFQAQEKMLQEAFERGSSDEEFTNNVGYAFVALLPALVLFHKKPIIQYIFLIFCSYFIIMGMKRGAILIWFIVLLWFLVVNLKNTPKKRKWIVILVSVMVVIAGVYYINYMMETSAYFLKRVEQTLAGDSSGRNHYFEQLFNYYVNENNILKLVLGNGADATVKIAGNYAHNDWIEILINQGLLGVVVYLSYWISFFVTWRKTKIHPQAFMALGMFMLVFFLSALFSMSYNSISRCAAMVIGYYLAIYNEGQKERDNSIINAS